MNVSRIGAVLAVTLTLGVAYPAMAPLSEYAMDRQAEIALARSAAPPSVSGNATVLVFTSHGYETAAKGSDGFTCLVERSWMKHFEDPEFWDGHIRGPVCYNDAASRSILPYTLFRTDMVLKGVSKPQMFDRIKAAVAAHQLPELQPGSMAYMMSKQQYLTELDLANGVTRTSWHPHVMFFAPISDAADGGASFGANLKGSPVITDTTGGVPEPWTIFFVPVWHWSDGSPGPVVNMSHAT